MDFELMVLNFIIKNVLVILLPIHYANSRGYDRRLVFFLLHLK